MRTGKIVTSILAATILVAGAIALSTEINDADAVDAKGKDPGNITEVSRAPQPDATRQRPTPVGRCVTDAALRRRCEVAYNQCIFVRQRGPVCATNWNACCASHATRDLEQGRFK